MTLCRRFFGPRSASCAATALVLALLCCLTGRPSFAASGTWNNGTGNWSDTTKWSGGTVADGAGFTGNITNNINSAAIITINTTSRTLGILNIGDTNDNNSYTITSSGGATFTFDNNAANAQLNQLSGSNGDTISVSLLLKSSLDISNADNSLLTISTGGITSSAASGTQTITNKGTGSGGVTISGVIGNGGTGGTVAVTQNSSSSTLTLSGANTYTGLTSVTAGTLAEGATGSIADTSALTVNGATAIFSLGASHSDTVATVTLDGGGSITGTGTSALTSTGSFEMKSGSVSAILAGSGIALNKTTSGTVTLSGANTYTGATTVTAGTLAEGATGSIADTSALTVNGATAIFNLGANHSDTVATVTLDGGGSITGTGTSALTSTGSFEMKSGSASAILAGSGIVLNKTTGGTVTLSGANTYTGGTTVNAGTLFVNNTSGSGTGSGAVVVNNSGTLGGSGTITGPSTTGTTAVTLNNSAKINAGGTAGTVGTLNINNGAFGALTLNNTSIFSADLQNVGSYDKVNLTGMLALANTSVLEVNTLGGFTTTAGQMFTLINNDGTDAISGTFSNAPTDGSIIISGSFSFYVNYDGGTGNDLVLTTVPEPSTWLAAALALGAIGFSQRRRLRACAAPAVKKHFYS